MSRGRVTYSSFLRGPSDVVPRLDDGDVLLERRDGVDLVLSTAPRADALLEGLGVSIGALRRLVKIAPAVVEEVLREELPWIAWLPVDEQSHCVAELLTDLGAGLSVENFSRFHDDMVAWRSTSAVWADPTLAEDLQRELNGNAGSVERPGIG